MDQTMVISLSYLEGHLDDILSSLESRIADCTTPGHTLVALQYQARLDALRQLFNALPEMAWDVEERVREEIRYRDEDAAEALLTSSKLEHVQLELNLNGKND